MGGEVNGYASSLFLLIFLSSFLVKTPVNKKVEVAEDEPVKVATLELNPKQLGALRIDVKSFFPNNHWVVYELQLVDSQGEVIASAMDEAWQESGTWREGGESGIWSESDLLGGWDIKSQNAEKIELVIAVLESGTASGNPADLVVSFDVKVKSGVIQKGHLWWGLIYTSILGILARKATKASGQQIISTKIKDSDPKARTILGGENNLIRLNVKTRFDEDTPRRANIHLKINNVYGEKVYQNQETVSVSVKSSESAGITWGTATLESFFLLKDRNSYSFQVRIEPDEPVEWTSLTVREGAQTLKAVDVVEIRSIPLSGQQKHITIE